MDEDDYLPDEVLNCLDVNQHVEHCPICSELHSQPSLLTYQIVIAALIVALLYMAKKLYDVKTI